jgi:hypothetical protein
MRVEVGGKYFPVPDLQNLGAMGESTVTSTAESSRRARDAPYRLGGDGHIQA